jgi:DNA (cytosine-5)-methyltransferase 1
VSLTVIDFFCGAGGSSQGAAALPDVRVELAANHWDRAIESHAMNFPQTDHFKGDIHDADVARFPAADLFWASPECPAWSGARGKRRDFDQQPDLFGETLPDPAADRSRALMWDVPRYLETMKGRGRPVLAGVVENVTEVRQWAHWGEWLASIRNLGYSTRLVALNSMHARPRVTAPAPQSRDRLYLCYWLSSLKRQPDWDKHLRPDAWCPQCEAWVRAVQWWKRPGADMGRYRQSYLYRCPNMACRNAIVEPPVLPAAAALDWSDLGTRIGDRPRPMREATRARIAAGLARYARPLTARTTTATKALACPPLLVPAGGTWRAEPAPADVPMPARTTRENDGVAFPPFITVHRGGTSDARTVPMHAPLSAVTASGNHLGLAVPDAAFIMRNNTPRGDPGQMVTPSSEPIRTLTTTGHQSLLVPYYGNATTAQPVTKPSGTIATHDRYGLATGTDVIPVDDVLFRMLKAGEIGRAMAFGDTYVVLGTQREKVRQYGNAVTPPVAEVLFSALVEAIAPESNLEAA